MSAEKPTPIILLALALFCVLTSLATPGRAQPGPEIVGGRMMVEAPAGRGVIPIAASLDWATPQPQVTRAVVMLHGRTRVARQYEGHLRAARDAARGSETQTLLLVPQFLAEADIAAHALGAEMLHWHPRLWAEGAPALAPTPLSSFDVLDAILAQLSDRRLFPALRHVVLAGHSAGAQLAQRYAVVGRRDTRLRDAGIALRFVIANPSSWLWFGDDRPYPAAPGTCPSFNQWRYGLAGAPPYVQTDVEGLERRYLAHDVVYLLGDRDRDPNHRMLDRSCAASTQGEHRFARGMHFMFNLELRQPNQVYHRLFIVRDVAHDAAGMFTSRCGLAALFDHPGCVGLP